MSLDIASLVRGLFESDGETSTEIERKANALVSGDVDQLTNDQASLAWPASLAYAAPTLMTSAGVHDEAGADLDDAVEETLVADLSVEELVQRRKQLV